MNLTELAEKYGESIDNLPIDILMEGIYNERYAHVAGVFHDNETGVYRLPFFYIRNQVSCIRILQR